MDQASQEKLRLAKAEAAALAGEPDPAAPVIKEITLLELLTMVSKGEGLPDTLKNAAAAAIKAESLAGATRIPVTIQNDPWQREIEVREVPVSSLPKSAQAPDFSAVIKQVTDATDELTKMVEGQDSELAKGVRAAIQKGTATEKLAEISRVLALKIETDASEDEWRVRDKIGSLICLLTRQAQLERVLNGETTTLKTDTAKAEAQPVEKAFWPKDMNAMDFDEKTKRFTQKDPLWGRDTTRAAR